MAVRAAPPSQQPCGPQGIEVAGSSPGTCLGTRLKKAACEVPEEAQPQETAGCLFRGAQAGPMPGTSPWLPEDTGTWEGQAMPYSEFAL